MNGRFLLGVVSGLLLVGAGCSEVRNDKAPTAPALAFHGDGFADPTSANFHGNTIEAMHWDMRGCKTCHGSAYDGGTAGVSCRTCHTAIAGPENCTTCHGGVDINNAPPKDTHGNVNPGAPGVGAHQAHLAGSSIATALTCTEGCHIVPASVYTPGHLDTAGTRLSAPVTFANAVASTVTNEPTSQLYNPAAPTYTPTPAYDASTRTCNTVYCHGYFKNGNLTNAPVWNDTAGIYGQCGSCHGDRTKATLAERALPKTSAAGGTHVNDTRCWLCHGDVVDANLNFIDKSKHINGKLDFDNLEIDF